MDTPRVIGLDLSMTATGIAHADGATTTVKPASSGDHRLNEIRSAVHQAAGGLPRGNRGIARWVDLAVIEDLPTHARAAGITGMVHGAVRSLLTECGVAYVVVPPATLKAFATGKGNADKTAMAIAALKRVGAEFADDNQCDAWWLRQAGLHHLGAPEFPLPSAQAARLDKVTWPQPAAA
ncbi:RuvC family protein [Streptomonospora nanhaiensis]|uniref:hypothetical protein n=1 Tax=Streptomonospora nanhaiensis TaxID=1323731 RepID=UPI001C38FFEE|nr:hypothetical protein [Streptomonospora nanhaiensis]MBV2366947.1 hypothetical protein [Streptomonospora nanhaiensis]